MLNRLNYNHLYYFFVVAKYASVTRACAELRLAQSTVSAQLKALEEVLGEKLLEKHGRNIKLTEAGVIAQRYCTQIFELGTEMCALIEGETTGKPELLRVGVADTLPKLLVYRILAPLYEFEPVPRITVVENSSELLLGELAIHTVDAVILDCPIPPSVNVRAYNHFLGECGISFIGTSALADLHTVNFPHSLAIAPVLLPTLAAAVRSELDRWFERQSVVPNVTAEFQDSALMKIFGGNGKGIFPVPTLIEKEVCKELRCKVIGRIPEPLDRYYLISTQRRLKNPILARIGGISNSLFAPQ